MTRTDPNYPAVPRVAVGALVIRSGAVLLVKRGKAPADGQWAIPGGSVELGETLQQAAEREILEETGIQIKAASPVYTFDFIERDQEGAVRFHYVIIDLAAAYLSGDIKAGDDADQAAWIPLADLERVDLNATTRRFLVKYLQGRT
jgi:ADP-ribose pyrophosphatase